MEDKCSGLSFPPGRLAGGGESGRFSSSDDTGRKDNMHGFNYACAAAFGIDMSYVGGEAAHGVEARNDQNGRNIPEPTTSFPQPIGMSASWDTELIKKAGEVTGTEARVLWHRHPAGGLSRWAPTVDLERDPRWGRNEEGYGEDPVLTGAMAGAYIEGMQGDDPNYLRIAATLKHFYANNTERGRGWKMRLLIQEICMSFILNHLGAASKSMVLRQL